MRKRGKMLPSFISRPVITAENWTVPSWPFPSLPCCCRQGLQVCRCSRPQSETWDYFRIGGGSSRKKKTLLECWLLRSRNREINPQFVDCPLWKFCDPTSCCFLEFLLSRADSAVPFLTSGCSKDAARFACVCLTLTSATSRFLSWPFKVEQSSDKNFRVWEGHRNPPVGASTVFILQRNSGLMELMQLDQGFGSVLFLPSAPVCSVLDTFPREVLE